MSVATKTDPTPGLERRSAAQPAGAVGSMTYAGSAVGVHADNQKRAGFRFRITAEGLMLLLIIMLVGFAAWHSGTNLLYLIFAILVAAYLVHGFILSLNLAGLRVQSEIPNYVSAGEPFTVELTLLNKKRYFAANSIRVDHLLAGERRAVGSAYYLRIASRRQQTASYVAVLSRRGIHKFSRSVVSTRYPFGFEERTLIFADERHLLVLPRTFPVTPDLVPIPSGFGEQESNVRGAGSELYGFREYVNGEPARLVHWRTSARAQKMMVAEFTREERRRLVLVLDNCVSENNAKVEAAFEIAVSLTASLARFYINAGFEVGLLTQCDNLAPASGAEQLLGIRRALAILEPAGEGARLVPTSAAIWVHYLEFHQPAPSGSALEQPILHLNTQDALAAGFMQGVEITGTAAYPGGNARGQS